MSAGPVQLLNLTRMSEATGPSARSAAKTMALILVLNQDRESCKPFSISAKERSLEKTFSCDELPCMHVLYLSSAKVP